MKYLLDRLKNERAAAMVEYAVLIAGIAIFLVITLGQLGASVSDTFTAAANQLTAQADAGDGQGDQDHDDDDDDDDG